MGQTRRTEAGRRLAALVKELSEDYARTDGERGVGSKVAKELGLDPAVVSKIRNDEYEPGNVDASTIERVCAALKMRAAFFFDRWTEPRSYRAYLDSAPTIAATATTMPSTDDALANAAILDLLDSGERITPDELRELRAAAGLAAGVTSVQEAAHRFLRYLAGIRATAQRGRHGLEHRRG